MNDLAAWSATGDALIGLGAILFVYFTSGFVMDLTRKVLAYSDGKHWQSRAEYLEKENERLRAKIAVLESNPTAYR